MSTVTISTTYAKGFPLKAPIQVLDITSSGAVLGKGIIGGTAAAYTIHNSGLVHASGSYAGISLRHGGSVSNNTASLIEGYYGLAIAGGVGTVANLGKIEGTGAKGSGIGLAGGGSVTNGSATDLTALIEGKAYGIGIAGPGAVVNFATIKTTGSGPEDAGVGIAKGGQVTNGSTADTKALIEGQVFGVGITGGVGRVVNFGTIKDTGLGTYASGVGLQNAGTVTNGSTADHKALIEGSIYGVGITGGTGIVSNFGTIIDTGATGNRACGVGLAAGGQVTNGSTADAAALIEGRVFGIGILGSGGTVSNFGTVESLGTAAGDVGVILGAGGKLVNGSAKDKKAVIGGAVGVAVGGVGTVVDYGTIASASGTAVLLESKQDLLKLEGGAVLTGAAIGDGAQLLLAGDSGPGTVGALGQQLVGFGLVDVLAGATWTLQGASTVAAGTTLKNSGSLAAGTVTVEGSLINGGMLSAGVTLSGAGALTNNEGATIQGSRNAVSALAAGAVVNLGTVISTSTVGIGVYLGHGGAVTNGSATDADALIRAGYAVTIQGAAGTVTNFGAIDSTDGGPGVGLADGGEVINAAGGTIDGDTGVAIAVAAGTVSNSGKITGTSVGVSLKKGGMVRNLAGGEITGGIGVGISGAAGTLVNYGTVAGTHGTAVILSSSTDMVEVGGKAAFAGNVEGGGGTLELVGGQGAGTLSGLGSSFSGFGAVIVVPGAEWTLAGSAALGTAGLRNGGTLTVAGTLTTGGSVTNSGTLIDEGAIVLDLATASNLTNGAGAIIDLAGDFGIGVSGSGSGGSFANSGTVEKTAGSGTAVIAEGVSNKGTLAVTSGTLDVTGAVSASGIVSIGKDSTFELGGSMSNTGRVDFVGADSSLVLEAATAFKATIVDFAAGDSLTLTQFGTGTSIAFSTATDTLTVTNGSLVANVKLFGTYVAAGFHDSSSAAGTVITYVPPPQPATLAGAA